MNNTTASSTSLKQLKVGDRGVIARIRGAKPAVTDQLRKLGLSPGTSITLEQRSPRFLVRTFTGQWALTQAMIQAIYVQPRIT